MTEERKDTVHPPQSTAAAPRASAVELRRLGLLAGLGRAVRTRRQARRLSQQALATAAGLSPRFVAQLEAGSGNISVGKLAEIARALQVPLEALFMGGGASAGEHAEEAVRLRTEIVELLRSRPINTLRGLAAALRGMHGHQGQPLPPVISLVGLRGAGKSTVGPLLGQALERPFVELDEQIQEEAGMPLAEIFELHGEGHYRELERQSLERLLDTGRPAVLAVSGGAVTDDAVFRLLKERTLLVWLRATPEQHMERVVSQGDRRPMADRPDAMAELRSLLQSRTPYYQQAQVVADTSGISPEACVGQLMAQLELLAS